MVQRPKLSEMTTPQRKDQPHHVSGEAAFGPDTEILEEILEPGINICNWQRTLPGYVQADLVAWTQTLTERVDVQLKRGSPVPPAALAGLAGPTRDWLVADLASLSARYMHLAQANPIRFSFGPVNRTQCPKFHVDHIALRLLCTYVGPGTEWLPEHALRRSALAKRSASTIADNAKLLVDAAALQRAQPGNVLVMKGERFGDGTPGVVHRSPAIEASGLTRLVLTLSVMPSPNPPKHSR